MPKFKEGDIVVANYITYSENGIVTKVVEVSATQTDYYVRFGPGNKDFDIFDESELEKQEPNATATQ